MAIHEREPLISNDPLNGVEIFSEYELIKNKRSMLSRSKREAVVMRYHAIMDERERLESQRLADIERRIEEEHESTPS